MTQDDSADRRSAWTLTPPAPAWAWRVYAVAAVVLITWTTYLAVHLPRRNISHHWDVTWVGFDLLLAAALARTGWLAYRRLPTVELPAVATAVLLVVDAWFDVTTAAHDAALVQAVVSAALIELPLAAFCLHVARRAERWRRERARELALLPPDVGAEVAKLIPPGP